MNKIAIIVSFAAVLVIHFIWVSSALEPNLNWVDSAELLEQSNISGYKLYFQDKAYFLGLSYALAIAFSVFAISRFKIDKSKGLLGVFGGVSFSASLYTFGCLLIGCCGSPMITVYAGLFGSSFLGFTKPIIFLITVLSVGLGAGLMIKKTKEECCSISKECD